MWCTKLTNTQSLPLPASSTVISVFQIIYIVECMSEDMVEKSRQVFLSALHAVTSGWWLETDIVKRTHTKETGKHYQPAGGNWL